MYCTVHGARNETYSAQYVYNEYDRYDEFWFGGGAVQHLADEKGSRTDERADHASHEGGGEQQLGVEVGLQDVDGNQTSINQKSGVNHTLIGQQSCGGRL